MRGDVLIIDDNEVDLKVVSTVLDTSGYASFAFQDYREGVEWIEKSRPVMIFLDLNLTEMTGYELIPFFRRHAHTADIPILIISGKNQVDDVKKAISLGASDYVVKPLDILVLQEKIRKIGSSGENEFSSVIIQRKDHQSIQLTRPMRLVALSEFGAKILTEEKIPQGGTFEIGGLHPELFAMKKLWARCLSSALLVDGSGYEIQVSFVGLTEAQRRVLRQACRSLWIQAKGAA